MGLEGVKAVDGLTTEQKVLQQQNQETENGSVFDVYRQEAGHVYDRAYKKQRRKEVIENYEQQDKEKGVKTNDNQNKKDAKYYVKNERREEEFEARRVYLDKKEYKEAEKARKAEKEKLVEQYRKEGLSKKEAKAKADAQLVDNKYLHKGLFGSSARKYIERNQDLFYEDGKFSNDKLKEYVKEQAQLLNQQEGEGENYRYSVKESEISKNNRNVEAKNGQKSRHTTAHQQRMVSKVSGMNTELSYDTAIKTGIVLAATGAGAAIGAAASSTVLVPFAGASAAADAAAAAGAAGAVAASVASSAATVGAGTVTAATSYIGLGAGLGAATGAIPAGFKLDKGEKPRHVRDLKDFTPVTPVTPHTPVVPDQPIQLEQPGQPVTPVEPQNPVKPVSEEPCNVKYVVANGESPAAIAKKTGVPLKTILEMNKDRLHRFYTNVTVCDDKKKTYGFLVGQEIELPCEAKIEKHDAKKEQAKYAAAIKNKIPEICDNKLNSVAHKSVWNPIKNPKK